MPSAERGRRRGLRRLGLWTAVLVLMWPIASQFGVLGEPWFYFAEPIEGRVIDYEARQPLEGVVVVARWVLEKPPEGHAVESWVVIEAVTDAQGRYRVRGWGPKWRPWWRWLDRFDPEIILFKSGYWPRRLGNAPPKSGGWSFNEPGTARRKAFWNGRDIELRPFKLGEPIPPQLENPNLNPYSDRQILTEAEWADQLARMQGAVGWYGGGGTDWSLDDWRRIANLVRAVNRECLRLPQNLRRRIQDLPAQHAGVLLEGATRCP